MNVNEMVQSLRQSYANCIPDVPKKAEQVFEGLERRCRDGISTVIDKGTPDKSHCVSFENTLNNLGNYLENIRAQNQNAYDR
jgi:hypothetical protein